MLRKFTLLTIILGSLQASLYGNSTTTLAVFEIADNTGRMYHFTSGLPDMLITELLPARSIRIVERSRINQALDNFKIESSGLTQEAKLKVGQWLGADQILLGSLNLINGFYRLDVRTIEVATGEVYLATHTIKSHSEIHHMVAEIGQKLRTELAPSQPGASLTPHPSNTRITPELGSASISIQYKILLSLFTDKSVPFQVIRVIVNGEVITTSPLIKEVNRNYTLARIKVPVGMSQVALLHGKADAKGNWIEPMDTQPQPFYINTRKDRIYNYSYSMRVENRRYSFSDIR
jgi:TolB-like protein